MFYIRHTEREVASTVRQFFSYLQTLRCIFLLLGDVFRNTVIAFVTFVQWLR
jgi:hypothetical protein